MSSLPINFEPNLGQSTTPALYLARTGAVEIDLDHQGFDLWMAGKEREPAKIDVRFVGARKDANVAASFEKLSETNYLLGQDPAGWRTHIRNYGRVTYLNLYSGIDAVFYGNGEQLEHDFVVAPGADYRRIRLRLGGARQLMLDADGDLRVLVAGGELSFHRPVAYQNGAQGRQEREARFVMLRPDEVAFQIGDYDRSRPLFIDPVLSYSTYLANLSINMTAVAADSSGNAYVTGMTWSASYPTTPGAFDTTCEACQSNYYPDVFITKFSADGSGQVFSTFLGGNNYNQSSGIAVDAQGNVVVVGWTNATDFPVQNAIPHGTIQYPGGPYGFVTSLSPSGASLNYSSVLGGFPPQGPNGLSTYTNAVALDMSGNAYITGTTASSFLPATPGALNLATPGQPSYVDAVVYLSKFTPAGALAYSALLGDVWFSPPYGDGPIGVTGIAVDASGNAYIVGDSGSMWPTTSGAYQTTMGNAGSNKAPFVSKISADGSTLLYSTYMGTDATMAGIAVDGSGDAFVTGSYAPSSFPTTSNAYEATLPSGSNASFFSELNPSGSGLLYSSFLYGAGSGGTAASAITLDGSGNIWLAGMTADPQYLLVNPIQSIPGTNGYYQSQAGFLSEFDPTGANLLFSTYFASQTTPSWITGLAFDGAGKLHIAGVAGPDLYTTPGAFLGSVTPPPPHYQYTYGYVAAIDPLAEAPAVCVSYPQNQGLQFGYVAVGSTSSQNLTVKNCGTEALTISTVAASPSVYTVPAASDQCLSSVAPGNSCTLAVTFTPTAVQQYPGALTLTSNAAIPVTTLSLQGYGAVPVISVTPTSVTFDPTFVGTTSPQQSIYIQNQGQAPLELNFAQTEISPQFAFTQQGCGGQIYSVCTLLLTFTPQSAGNITGTLTIASNDPVTPIVTVNLSGTAYASYPVPTVNSVNPPTVAIGSTGITLQVKGQNFFAASMVMVNGVAQKTTFQGGTYLFANLDPSLLTSMGELPVTVVNPAPGGGTSTPVTLTVYLSIPLQVAGMVYEQYSRMLYASIPASATSNPNTVVSIDPLTGNMGTPIAVGNDPQKLAVSDDGQYLYVALNGDHAIQRINLSRLAVEKTFPLPVDSGYGVLDVTDMHVVPGSPKVVVATLYQPYTSPSGDGIAAFNDSGLINWIPGYSPNPSLHISGFAFAGNPPVIYAMPYTIITLDSSGLHYTPPSGTTGTTPIGCCVIASDGSLLYTSWGQVWDPSTQTLLGTYSPVPVSTPSVLPDDSLSRTFFLDTTNQCDQSIYANGGGICAFDQSSFNQSGALAFPLINTSNLAWLARWGNDGFAFIGTGYPPSSSNGQIIIFRSSLAHVTTGTNPVPVLTSLSTSVVAAGGPNFQLGITGSSFVPGAVVNLDGNPRTTTYSSATQLTAYISQADIASAGRALITVTNPAAGGGTSAPLTLFIGAASQVLLDPISLSFGSLVVGSSSGQQTVTVTNAGLTELAISSIAASGDFAETHTCGNSLASGASCTISVTFSPTVAGSRSGTLTLTDNDMGNAGSTQTISLAGTGTAAAATVSPASLTFPGQAFGTTSAPMTVTLSNTGNSPLTVSKINVTGSFAETDTCVGVVGPMASCAINVTFTPTVRGSNTGGLSIVSNASNSPNLVSLTGNGTSALIALSQFSLYFSNELVGIPSGSQTIVVSNPGEVTLTITSILVTGDFAQTNSCGGGVPPGGSCSVNVTFTPSTAGWLTGTLNFVDNAPGTSPVVSLYGTGTTSYPTPAVEQLSPPEAVAGAAAFTLTVNGSGFGSGSVVYWSGSARSTTFVNGGQLTASILATDVATVGTPLVTVLNPSPGGPSTGVGFDVITPSPTFTFLKTDIAVGKGPASTAFGDFNGDGKTDLAVLNWTDQSVSILLGKGDGTYQPAVNYVFSAFGPSAVVAGDFNNDGKLDLAIASSGCANYCSGGSIVVLLGNGDGTFQSPLTTQSTDTLTTLAVGDFNGDGKLDLVAGAFGYSSYGQIDIFLGNGDGTFQTWNTYPTGGQYSQAPAVLVADFNGDGKLDVATANGYGYQTTTASILLGNGDGTFQPQVQYNTGLSPYGIAAADLNGDGKLDLVVSNEDPSANSVSVLLGNGDGTFAAHVDYPTGVGATAVAVGDFNGDGKLDLAVADSYSNTISLLRGNGDGTFQANQDFVVGVAPDAILAKDLNGDGRTDLVLANYGSNTISVLLQISAATLAPTSLDFNTQGVGTTSSPQSVTLNNNGAALLAISAIGTTGDFAVASGTTCSTTSPVPGGGNCTINLTFTPTAQGSRAGTLTITDNSNAVAGSMQVVTLTGTGVLPAVSLSTASLSFASQLSGTTSSPQTVTLTNTGLAALTLKSITVTGANATDFAQTNDCGTTVAVKGTCTISVTYTPTTGGSETAAITIIDNAADSPQTVTLSGTGQDFTAGPASGSSTSQSVTAGQTATYNLSFTPTGASGTLTLSCAGAPAGATCAVNPTSLALSGASAANATVTVTTTAKTMGLPQGRGDYPALNPRPLRSPWGFPMVGLLILAILTSVAAVSHRRKAPILALAAALLVVAVWAACGGGGLPTLPAAAVNLSASSLAFNSQNMSSTSAPQAVTLTNSGNASLAITSIALGGSNSGDFTQTNTCFGAVAAGANCQINVKFSPTATGARTGSVTITDDASGSPQSIGLSGTGVPPATPPGSHTLTITATLTSSSGTLMHTIPLALTVN